MQLQDYALGNMKQKINLGYAERGCGVTSLGTRFVPVDTELRPKKYIVLCYDSEVWNFQICLCGLALHSS